MKLFENNSSRKERFSHVRQVSLSERLTGDTSHRKDSQPSTKISMNDLEKISHRSCKEKYTDLLSLMESFHSLNSNDDSFSIIDK